MKNASHTLNMKEKILWMRLALSKGIGPITFWKILRKAKGNIEQACSFAKDLVPESYVETELIKHEKRGFQVLTGNDPNFPQKLLHLKDCPAFLSFSGDLSLLQKRSIAIVGARNASLLGKILATKIAKDLGEKGFIIVSGMARGIDTAAHEGSLETGSLAVLAGGLDIVYPPENVSLYKKLKEQGGILSEMPLGVAIDASLFPRRNRIIAGLAESVVLIEAATQSGSLITAEYALENGKEIFAVPGFPSDPRSRGCNQLIKQGATLVESAEDICNVLGVTKKNEENQESLVSFESPAEEDFSLKNSILQEIGVLPVSLEALFQTQNCSLPHLLNLLTELEVEGKIQRYSNSDVSLKINE